MLGGFFRLVHQGDQGAARDQLAQQLGQHLVAHELGHAHMKVSQQFHPAGGVLALQGRLLLFDMCFERLDAGGRGSAHKSPRHLHLQHAAHGKHLPGLFYRRGGDKGAARRFQPDQAVLRQLKQGLAHQRARDAKVVGQLLLGQLGAGVQTVVNDGFGQGLNDRVGGGRFHEVNLRPNRLFVYTFGEPSM